MKIKSILAFAGLPLAMLLAACQTAAPVSPTPSPAPPASPTVPAVATQPLAGTRVPGCTVASSSLPDGPPPNSPIPPVDAQDWAHGPADAAITIVEYGDFQ